MGGFYPMPARPGSGAWLGRSRAAPLDAPVARAITLRAPPRLALVVDGQPIVDAGRARPSTVESGRRPLPDDRHRRVLRPADTDRRRARRALPAPQPRPPGQRGPAAALRARGHRRAGARDGAPAALLQSCATGGWPPARPAGSRWSRRRCATSWCRQHGDVILVSDQIFRIFPFDRLRKYHRMELARAVFAAVVGRRRSRARGADRIAISRPASLAAYLTRASSRCAEFKKIEYRRGSAAPIDFVPAVDQLHVRAAARLVVDLLRRRRRRRRDPRRRAPLRRTRAPSSAARLQQAARSRWAPRAFRCWRARCSPRAAAAPRRRRDCSAPTWTGSGGSGSDRCPRVNYRPGRRARHAGRRRRRRVDDRTSRREGRDDPRAGRGARSMDRAGGAQTLHLGDARGRASTFDVELPAGLKSVEIDPRPRLVETALGSLRRVGRSALRQPRPTALALALRGLRRAAQRHVADGRTSRRPSCSSRSTTCAMRSMLTRVPQRDETDGLAVGGGYSGLRPAGRPQQRSTSCCGGPHRPRASTRLRARRWARRRSPGTRCSRAPGPRARHARLPRSIPGTRSACASAPATR